MATGIPPRSIELLACGERVSVITAMSTQWVLTLKVVRGTVDGTFLEFVEKDLLPVLQAFNGTNYCNSVVIMDELFSAPCGWY